MTFIFATIGVLAVLFLLWRAFGPQSEPVPAGPARKRGPVGPDDDPDFLLDLDRKSRDGKTKGDSDDLSS